MNSWEAIFQGVKPEYLGLDSNNRGFEIYSLGPQVSIIAPQKWKRMPGGGWPGSCSQAVKDRANNLSGVGLYNARNSSCIIYQTKVYRTWRSWYPRKTKAGNAHCTFIYLYHHISVRSCLPPSAHAKKRNRQPCDQRRKNTIET